MTNDSQFPEADLARLADGSLEADRAAQLRAEVERSPELTRAMREQDIALTMLRSLDVPAPDALRERLREQARTTVAGHERRPAKPARRARRRPPVRLWPGFGAAVALAAAVAVIVVLAGGATSGPNVEQTGRLALAAAVYPAPGESNAHPGTVDATAAGIRFPYWAHTVGWRAVGARADTLAGRSIETVFYASRQGRRVGYAIVGGAPVSVGGGRTETRFGVPFTFARDGSARLVTWVRSGHTCVIAGRGVSDATLLTLALAA